MSAYGNHRPCNLQENSSFEDVQIMYSAEPSKSSWPSKAGKTSVFCGHSTITGQNHQHFDTSLKEEVPECPASVDVPVITITTRNHETLCKLEQGLSNGISIVYKDKDEYHLKLTLIVSAKHFIKVVNMITSGHIVTRDDVYIGIKDHIIGKDHALATEVAAYKDFDANIKAFLAQLKTSWDQGHHAIKFTNAFSHTPGKLFSFPVANQNPFADTLAGVRKVESMDDCESDGNDIIMIESLTKEDKIETIEIRSEPVSSTPSEASIANQTESSMSELIQLPYMIISLKSVCSVDSDSPSDFTDYIKSAVQEIVSRFNDTTTMECITVEPTNRKHSVGVLVAPWAFQACIERLNNLQYKDMKVVARGMIKPKYIKSSRLQIEKLHKNIHNTQNYWKMSGDEKRDLRCRSMVLPVLDLEFAFDDYPDFLLFEKIFIHCGITVVTILETCAGKLSLRVLPCNLNTGLEKLTKILIMEYHLKADGKQTRLHLAMADYCEHCIHTLDAPKGQDISTNQSADGDNQVEVTDVKDNITDGGNLLDNIDGGIDSVSPVVEQAPAHQTESKPSINGHLLEDAVHYNNSGTLCTCMDNEPVEAQYPKSKPVNVDDNSAREQKSNSSAVKVTHDRCTVNVSDLIDPAHNSHRYDNTETTTTSTLCTQTFRQTHAQTSTPLAPGIPGQIVNSCSGTPENGNTICTKSTLNDLNTKHAQENRTGALPICIPINMETQKQSLLVSNNVRSKDTDSLVTEKIQAKGKENTIQNESKKQNENIEVLVPQIVVSKRGATASVDEKCIIDHLMWNNIEVLHIDGDSDKHIVVDPRKISDAVDVLLKFDRAGSASQSSINVELATDPMVIMVSVSTQAKYHLTPVDEWDGQWEGSECQKQSNLQDPSSSCSSKPNTPDLRMFHAHVVVVKCNTHRKFKDYYGQNYKQVIKSKLREVKTALKLEKIHIFKEWGKKSKRFAVPPVQVFKAISIIKKFKIEELDFVPFVGRRGATNCPVNRVPENIVHLFNLQKCSTKFDPSKPKPKKKKKKKGDGEVCASQGSFQIKKDTTDIHVVHGVELRRSRGNLLPRVPKKVLRYTNQIMQEVNAYLMKHGISFVKVFLYGNMTTYLIEFYDQDTLKRALDVLPEFRRTNIESWCVKQFEKNNEPGKEAVPQTRIITYNLRSRFQNMSKL